MGLMGLNGMRNGIKLRPFKFYNILIIEYTKEIFEYNQEEDIS